MYLLIKEKISNIRRKIVFINSRKKLTNKSFTIISNNCWGGHVYQDLRLEYKTPFIGMYLYYDCYMKLLQNLEYYLEQELQFSKSSKYESANRKIKNKKYPIGKLGDIELHMIHYANEEEAKEKWERRKKRISFENIFVKINEPNLFNKEDLEKINNLPYKNIVIFTKNNYKCFPNEAYFPNFSVRKEMYFYYHYFDFVKWLNEGRRNNYL